MESIFFKAGRDWINLNHVTHVVEDTVGLVVVLTSTDKEGACERVSVKGTDADNLKSLLRRAGRLTLPEKNQPAAGRAGKRANASQAPTKD